MTNHRGETMQQPLKFSKNTIHNINQYFSAEKTESKTQGSQVKITPTQKAALKSICKEHGMAESKFIRDAIDVYIERFPYLEKIKRHKKLMISLLESLP